MNNVRSEGVGVLGVIFIVLLILKLLNVVDLTWFWVTAPLWMPLVAFIAMVLLGFLVTAIALMFKKDNKEDKK